VSAPSPHPDDALLGLVYGELDKDEALKVEQHLKGCPECASTLARYRAVRRAATALPSRVEGAAGLESLLHYGAQAASRARRRRVAVRATAFLASVAAVALLFLMVRPSRAPEAPAVAASAPASVGPLAENDVAGPTSNEADFGQKQELRKAPARQRVSTAAGAGAPSSRASAAKALPPVAVADEKLARDLQPSVDRAFPTEPAAEAEANRPASAAPLPPSASMAKRVAVIGHASPAASGSAGAGTVALKKAAPSGARAEDGLGDKGRVDSALVAQDALAGADAGPLAQRRLDEGRQKALLARLGAAPDAELLQLLSELCAVEVRLAHRTEAEQVCGRVVRDYPGTSEAVRAQGQLQALRTP
jgi:anti-sigma factor RsiW